MSKIGIVIEREYMTRVRKKSFLLLTIFMPFLIVLLVAAPVFLGTLKGDNVTDVVVLDQTGKYAPVIMNAQKVDSSKIEGYNFIPAKNSIESYHKLSIDKDDDSDIIVLSITGDLSKNPKAAKLYSNGEIPVDLREHINRLLTKQVRHDRIAEYNIPEMNDVVTKLQEDYSISTVKWTENGDEADSSSDVAIFVGMALAMMIYMFVLSYGAMVMQSVMEEKTNRIVEVLVGSVRPFDLMMGKLIGVMLVGLTQIAVWGIMIMVISGIAGTAFAPAMPEMAEGAMAAQQTAAMTAETSSVQDIIGMLSGMSLLEMGLLFILYFLGGYILFSSYFAAVGAAVNSQEDSSQFMMPMIIVMIFAIYAAMGSLTNTDGPLAFWGSLFPLTAPIVMMVRLPFGVPLWQEVLSVALLYATAFLFVWIAAKIYRIGILSYGKKPTLKDMWKWLRYS